MVPLESLQTQSFPICKSCEENGKESSEDVKDINGRKKVHPSPLFVTDEDSPKADFDNDWKIEWHTLTPKIDNAGSEKHICICKKIHERVNKELERTTFKNFNSVTEEFV